MRHSVLLITLSCLSGCATGPALTDTPARSDRVIAPVMQEVVSNAYRSFLSREEIFFVSVGDQRIDPPPEVLAPFATAPLAVAPRSQMKVVGSQFCSTRLPSCGPHVNINIISATSDSAWVQVTTETNPGRWSQWSLRLGLLANGWTVRERGMVFSNGN